MKWLKAPNGTYALTPERGRIVARIYKSRDGWSWARQDLPIVEIVDRGLSGKTRTLREAKILAQATL